MALILCSECGKKVSDQARTCPKCGCPIKKRKKEFKKYFPTIISFVVSIIIFILLISKKKYCYNYSNSFTLLRFAIKEKIFILLIFVYGLLILGSFVFKKINKEKYKISKYLYISSLIFWIIINILIISKQYVLKPLYVFIYIFNSLLIFNELKFKKENLKENLIYIISIIIILAVTIIFFTNTKMLGKKSLELYSNINEVQGYLYVEIINDYINVRIEPDINSKKIGEVHKKDFYKAIEIVERNSNTWYKIIDSSGNTGYIANKDKYLKLSNSEKELETNSLISIISKEKDTLNNEKKENNNEIKNFNNDLNNYNDNIIDNTPNINTNTNVNTNNSNSNTTNNLNENSKKIIDATPKYKCQTEKWTLKGNQCTLKSDALAVYSCPYNYHVSGRFCLLDRTATSPSCRCSSGTLIGNKCRLSSGSMVSASCSCPSGYYYDGLTCSYNGETMIEADVDYYFCNEDGILNGSVCTYTMEATIYEYSCPSGYTLNDIKCIEN